MAGHKITITENGYMAETTMLTGYITDNVASGVTNNESWGNSVYTLGDFCCWQIAGGVDWLVYLQGFLHLSSMAIHSRQIDRRGHGCTMTRFYRDNVIGQFAVKLGLQIKKLKNPHPSDWNCAGSVFNLDLPMSCFNQ